MDGASVPALPPHYAVRAYLRQHPVNASKFIPDFARRFGGDCDQSYAPGRASAKDLEIAADRFKERASSARPFLIVETHVPSSKSLPHRERRGVCAFFMQPVGLVQFNRVTNVDYNEQAVLLRTLQAELRSKRALFGLGTGSLLLTRHLLERVYERTEAHHEEFARLIEAEFAELLHGVALATAAGIWVDAEDQHGRYRVGEVPFSNGLIKLEAREILGDAPSGQLGFWIGMAGREGWPFVNPASLIKAPITPEHPEMMAIEATCGVTYLNMTQLRPEQLEYLCAFTALKSEIGAEALDRMADAYCAPHFPHEKPPKFFISSEAEALLKQVRHLLHARAHHPSRSSGVCCLVHSEYTQAD